MPWGAVAGAAIGAVGSVVGGNNAANKAQKGADASIAEQQRQYDTTRNDNATALGARNYGLAQMQTLADQYKSGPSAQDVLNSPGYQFGLTQGLNRLNSNAAATGGLYSGNQLRAAGSFVNDYATSKYDDQLNNLRNAQGDQFNRYASLSGQGQVGANAINSAGQNAANNNSQTYQNLANVQGANAINQGNAFGNLGNAAASGASNWFNGSRSGFDTGGNTYGNMGGSSGGAGTVDYNAPNYNTQPFSQGGYADGGPVREPVVGSVSPVRGGSGGLSHEAILDAITQRRAAQVLKSGVGALPANPVTHPGAILDDRMRSQGLAHGGPVHGPGGPRDDEIPARLSNGEHVMDVASVNALGGGSNAVGQQRLNMLRAKLHGAC